MLIKNIKIDTISKDYKGICYFNDFKCFVDEAITGDVLDIEIYKETNKFYFAKIKKIITPSSYRNTNIECEYYKKCGGCALQHLNIDYYYKLKEDYIKKLFNINNIDIFKVGFGKRRRINLKYSNGKYGFYQKNTTNIVSINKCLNLTPSINSIINKLNNIKLTNLDSVDIFEVDNGIGMNFIFNKDPNINEFKKLDILKNDVISINYTYKDRKSFVPIIKNNDLFLTLKNKQILLPNNFFMQATKESQDFMINKVCEEIKDYKNVYDLYCGIGTYSFPLSDYNKKITCFEGEDLMIDSIKKNINKLNIKNLFFEKKDLYNQPITDFKNVDALVINPPRNGAGNQCKFIKNIDKIIYVSCNPETFKKDLEILKNNNYIISKIILIDQFFYSNHVEIICILKNNSI